MLFKELLEKFDTATEIGLSEYDGVNYHRIIAIGTKEDYEHNKRNRQYLNMVVRHISLGQNRIWVTVTRKCDMEVRE